MPTSVATLMAGARSSPTDPNLTDPKRQMVDAWPPPMDPYRRLSAIATWLWASKHRVWQQAQVQHCGKKLWGHRGPNKFIHQKTAFVRESEALLSDVAPNGEKHLLLSKCSAYAGQHTHHVSCKLSQKHIGGLFCLSPSKKAGEVER